MKRLVTRMLDRLAPGTMATVRELGDMRERYGSVQAALDVSGAKAVVRLEEENRRLRSEIDELRREGRYVAELYDLVIERVRSDARET